MYHKCGNVLRHSVRLLKLPKANRFKEGQFRLGHGNRLLECINNFVIKDNLSTFLTADNFLSVALCFEPTMWVHGK